MNRFGRSRSIADGKHSQNFLLSSVVLPCTPPSTIVVILYEAAYESTAMSIFHCAILSTNHKPQRQRRAWLIGLQDDMDCLYNVNIGKFYFPCMKSLWAEAYFEAHRVQVHICADAITTPRLHLQTAT